MNAGNDLNSFSFVREHIPINVVENIHKQLIPVSTAPFLLSPKEIFNLSPNKEKSGIILLTTGICSVYDFFSKKHVATCFAPTVVGLIDCYSSFYDIKDRPRNYLRADIKCEGFFVSTDTFLEYADKYSLWHDFAKILAHRLMYASIREKEMVGVNSYNKICSLLQELDKYPSDYRQQINIQTFIESRCNVSRSQTMKILSELRKGNYIEIKSGVLIKINKLPKAY